MILLAFLLPVALYLLALGTIHRRHYPLVVPGIWDCIGLLTASSGLLFLGGPAILSSLNERWRMFWLVGETSPATRTDSLWQLWIFLSILYFLVIVSIVSYMIWKYRHITSIYNVEGNTIHSALQMICAELGFLVHQVGDVYFLGTRPGQNLLDPPPDSEHDPSPGISAERPQPSQLVAEKLDTLEAESAVLELEVFPSMMHVNLRWEPADSVFRDKIETELRRALARTPTAQSEVGAWLTLSGLGLLGLFGIGLLALVLSWLLP